MITTAITNRPSSVLRRRAPIGVSARAAVVEVVVEPVALLGGLVGQVGQVAVGVVEGRLDLAALDLGHARLGDRLAREARPLDQPRA